MPRALPIACALATISAVVGTLCSPNAHWRSVVRHALLAVTAFAYPFFFGGQFLPWVFTALHLTLIAAAWARALAGRQHFVLPQALAAAFGIAVLASATQFFFPASARIVALSAVATFAVLLVVSMPRFGASAFPLPLTCAAALVLSEALVLLRFLPTHWMINAAVLGAIAGAALASRRTPRAAFSGLIVVLLLFGVIQ
ncbi:MAG: hypothetical protein Q7T01_03805 [bacterium]|nr:hypothetical protein [bacterium]